jgi:NTE family protein
MNPANGPVKRAKAGDGNAAVKPATPSPDQGLSLKNKQIVLLLQGGGALGAYQVGAFEALASECAKVESKIEWVAGISIGAINSAVIAAPKSGDSVRELELLWDDILSPEYPPFDNTDLTQMWLSWAWRPWLAALEPKYLNWTWMSFNPFGHAGFFSSRVLDPLRNPWMQQWFRKLDRKELAFYGTDRLAETLDKHVNWAALKNPRNTHLSLGATHVCDGEVEFFNSWEKHLNADHVRASGALPPAFPPIQIENEWYFDGGVSNNTPIEVLANKLFASNKDTLVFLIDLWDRKNDVLPESFDDVLWRQKCIQYGSRKKSAEVVVERYEHRVAKERPEHPIRLELCQVMLEHDDREPQFSFADADFSRSTFRKLRAQGCKDMMDALNQPKLVTDRHGQPLGGPYAALYRHGSQGKWEASQSEHQHQGSDRSDFPAMFEPWTSWWKSLA